ncbi:hypothetical protein [Amycolatopsis sp. CFH S0078]|uniref:hypothetical protein n=1 Tax=Amycolatopsis sp. CFH S0078 TaxID=1644108 RepID=UPI00106E64F7|nr:hypothetical protein [Amycolatopsis sp. CFH S0078]
MTEEYKLKRVDLGGSGEIYVGLHETPPVVLADHQTPEWMIDAQVRAALIKTFIAALEDDSGEESSDADDRRTGMTG